MVVIIFKYHIYITIYPDLIYMETKWCNVILNLNEKRVFNFKRKQISQFIFTFWTKRPYAYVWIRVSKISIKATSLWNNVSKALWLKTRKTSLYHTCTTVDTSIVRCIIPGYLYFSFILCDFGTKWIPTGFYTCLIEIINCFKVFEIIMKLLDPKNTASGLFSFTLKQVIFK